jgi:hypothetical protein
MTRQAIDTAPSSVDLPPGEHLALCSIIEHMFYYHKSGGKRPPCIRTNVYGHTERSRHAQRSEISHSTPKSPGNRQGFWEDKGKGKEGRPSERWVVEQRR